MKIKKNLFAKTAGVLALALLMLAACGGDSGGGGGGSLGDVPLELSGTVYTVGQGDSFFLPAYEKMTAAGPYSFTIPTSPGNIGGAGDITNGTLKFTAATPAAADLVSASTLTSVEEFEYFDSVTVTPDTAKGANLASLIVPIDGTVHYLSKSKTSGSESGTSMADFKVSMKDESVTYIYVDNDVTISAKGKETPEDGMTITTKDTTLNLKKGWNAIYVSASGTISRSGGTMTGSAKLSNPGLQWTASTGN